MKAVSSPPPSIRIWVAVEVQFADWSHFSETVPELQVDVSILFRPSGWQNCDYTYYLNIVDTSEVELGHHQQIPE